MQQSINDHHRFRSLARSSYYLIPRIAPEDHLIVVGSREAVEKFQALSPL